MIKLEKKLASLNYRKVVPRVRFTLTTSGDISRTFPATSPLFSTRKKVTSKPNESIGIHYNATECIGIEKSESYGRRFL